MISSTDLTAWPTDSSTLRQFLSIISDPDFRCHGTTNDGNPCRNPISKKIYIQVSVLLERIVKCGSFSSASTLLDEVARLIMCHFHHRKHSPARFKTWEANSAALEPSVKIEDSDGTTELASISPKRAIPQRQEIKVQTAPSDTTIKKEEETSTHTSSALEDLKPKAPNPARPIQPTQHKFEAFGNPLSTVAINRCIKDIIKHTPCKKELKSSGSVYIYTFPSNYHDRTPYLKIGNTSNLNRRMASWRRTCGYSPKLLVDFRADLFVKVERLVHATLRNERIREPSCPGCGIKHVEWFNVRSADASSAIATWTSWTRQEPYNEDGSLKKVWADRLERVDLTKPRCWDDFVDGKLDEDDSSEGSDLDLLEGIDPSDWSEDEFY